MSKNIVYLLNMENVQGMSRDALSKKLGLIDFSGDENFSPELIDDVLNSTVKFDANVDIAAIAKKIKNNKAKYAGART